MHFTALPWEHTCTRKFLRWLVCLCAEAMVTCPSFAATFVRLSSMPGVFHAAFWPPSSHRAVVRCAILGWHTARYLSQYAGAWASRDCSPSSLRSYHCMVNRAAGRRLLHRLAGIASCVCLEASVKNGTTHLIMPCGPCS